MSKLIERIFYKQRAEFAETLPERDVRFSFPENVEEIKDIAYLPDNDPSHRLDIYRPADQADKTLPVLINIHGGGLIMGCKEFNRYFNARLCQLGYVVFSLEYPLVPDCTFFDQCHTVFQAFDFVRDHAASYHGDTSTVYAVGDSGGACLLTYCVAMQNAPAVAKAAGVTPSTFSIRALGLISGMFYTNKRDSIGMFLPGYLYGKHYKKSAFSAYVNPEHPDIVRALPPCLLITSQNDSLQHYTLQFEQALTKQQVPHQLINYPKNKELTHAFSVFEPFLDASTDTLQQIHQFFTNTTEQPTQK